MNIGNLYKANRRFWLVYPSRDIPPNSRGASILPHEAEAVFYSKRLSNGSYISPNSIFVLLDQDGEFIKILSTNGELGWIIYPENEDWCKDYIKEVTV